MKRVLIVSLIVGLLVALFPPVAIAAPSPATLSQEPPPCNPRAAFLAKLISEQTGETVTCEYLMEYKVGEVEVGLGVIMKAYFLSTLFPGLDWEDLVERHTSEEGLGWGQIMKAYFLASVLEDVSPQELLDLRAEGKGWGEILQEYREGPGKPPWAHGGKPPWAGPHKLTE